MAGVTVFQTTTWGASTKPEWDSPGVTADGALVLDPGEVPLAAFEVVDVRGDEARQGKHTRGFRLLDTGPQISDGFDPGTPVVTVTNVRVVWRRRLGELEWSAGHVRFEWVNAVHDQTGLHLPQFVVIAPDGSGASLVLRVPFDAAAVPDMSDWLFRLAAAHKTAVLRQSGLADLPGGVDAITTALGKLDAGDPTNDLHLPRCAHGHRFAEEGGRLIALREPPAGFGEVPLVPPNVTLPEVPPSVAAHVLDDPTGDIAAGRGGVAFSGLYRVMALRGPADADGSLYPKVRPGPSPLVLGPGDGGPPTQFGTRSVAVSVEGHAFGPEDMLSGGVVLFTEERAIFHVPNVRLSDRYRGVGFGALTAVALNARNAAKDRAALGERVACGHLLLDWLDEVRVSVRRKKGTLWLRILDGASDPWSEPHTVSVGLSLNSGNKDVCVAMATQVAQRAAARRLSRGVADPDGILGRAARGELPPSDGFRVQLPGATFP